jgi:cell division protein ZapA (FtsZ GTPase activity inhibitor)
MITSVHEKIPEQPPLTVSVLAALNITEDYFKEKERGSQLVSSLEYELSKITNYLDTSINTSES